ncbi:NADH dehydrogenase [Rhizobiales bacterium GAS191]|nr:NADH dehydrogenase [Rhizobiales bacterium GAS191]
MRVASRHPNRAPEPIAGAVTDLESVHADVRDEASIIAAIADVEAVVNAVSLYVERGTDTFAALHVQAAGRVASLARSAGIDRLVHLSGIGADPNAQSPYIRSRGEGERAVRAAFPSAMVIRPAVMFGPRDSFVTPLAKLLKRLPIFPLFDSGQMRLQPVYVEDVAGAVTRCLRGDAQPHVLELGGPDIYSYQDLLKLIARHIGRRPVLLPMPFPLWRALAAFAEFLPVPPLTRNQVELMERDTVVSPGMPGLDLLGIRPTPIEDVLDDILA